MTALRAHRAICASAARTVLALCVVAGACEPQREEADLLRPEALSPLRYATGVATMHLGAPDGPVVGRLHPGATVLLVAEQGPHAEVRLRAFRDNQGRRLRVHVARGALSPTQPAAPAPQLSGTVARLELALHLSPDDAEKPEGFSRTRCKPLRVNEVKRSGDTPVAMRVAQLIDRVEITGWTSVTPSEHGPWSCPLPLVFAREGRLRMTGGLDEHDTVEVPRVPAGFVSAEPPRDDPIAAGLAARATLHWLTLERGKLRCIGWRMDPGHAEGEERLTGLAPPESRVRWRWSYLMGHFPAGDPAPYPGVSLLGPHSVWPDGRPGPAGYRCAESYLLVAANDDMLWMLPLSARDERARTLRAWHPDAAQRWYRHAAACEQAKTEAQARLDRDPAAYEGLGLHPCIAMPDDAYRWLDAL